MKEHEHAAKGTPESKPTQDRVAKAAYAIYLKEGHPQGHAGQNRLAPESRLQHTGSGQSDHHGHHNHHAHMAADFRKRFWISLFLTLPIRLSPRLQKPVGRRESIRFPGDIQLLFGFSSAVFWHGGCCQ